MNIRFFLILCLSVAFNLIQNLISLKFSSSMVNVTVCCGIFLSYIERLYIIYILLKHLRGRLAKWRSRGVNNFAAIFDDVRCRSSTRSTSTTAVFFHPILV